MDFIGAGERWYHVPDATNLLWRRRRRRWFGHLEPYQAVPIELIKPSKLTEILRAAEESGEEAKISDEGDRAGWRL